MKRNNITDLFRQNKHTTYKRRIAFHEAGHAAGIHLNNKARKLPPVFFKIIFKDLSPIMGAELSYQGASHECIARVAGGRLIKLLPDTIDGMAHVVKTKDYMAAFESDIINLLIGPLAEAKYVSLIDDEPFNHKLVNLNALKNYGGDSDLNLANEYLQSFFADTQQAEYKLNELFAIAFNFINNDVHWDAIISLADYILSCHKNTIYYEEIISSLEQSTNSFQNQFLKEINSEYHPIFCPIATMSVHTQIAASC